MDIMHMIGSDLDVTIWLRVARCLLLVVSSVLMLKEPMLCGGKNTPLHRLLAAFLFVAGIYSFSVGRLRMIQVANGTPAPIDGWTMLIEIAYTAMALLLVIKLGYDYYLWKQYHKADCVKRVCDGEGTCLPKMAMDDRRMPHGTQTAL